MATGTKGIDSFPYLAGLSHVGTFPCLKTHCTVREMEAGRNVEERIPYVSRHTMLRLRSFMGSALHRRLLN